MPTPADNLSSSRIEARFSLPVGDGVLNASAVVPAGRTTLTQLLPIIQNLENAIVGRVAQEAAEAGTPISCGPACGACCRQLVPVSLFEAEALTDWLRSLPEERRTELEQRFHRALMALRDAGVIDKIVDEKWLDEKERTTQLALDYFRAGVPCPFLENESCSIHAIRPLSCREYLVTSPPELCRDPAAHFRVGDPAPAEAVARAVCVWAAAGRGSARLDSAGFSAGVGEKWRPAGGPRLRQWRADAEEVPGTGDGASTGRGNRG